MILADEEETTIVTGTAELLPVPVPEIVPDGSWSGPANVTLAPANWLPFASSSLGYADFNIPPSLKKHSPRHVPGKGRDTRPMPKPGTGTSKYALKKLSKLRRDKDVKRGRSSRSARKDMVQDGEHNQVIE